MKATSILALAACAGLMLSACVTRTPGPTTTVDNPPGHGTSGAGSTIAHTRPEPGPIEPFMFKSIDYLVAAQHEDGGWGGGSHAAQNIRDPHAVKTDPGTTSFAAMALLRAGNTPFSGKYKDSVMNATEYVVSAVEAAKNEGPRITELTGTQLQSKLGQIIDTSMAAQFLARVLPLAEPDAALQKRVEKALDKCVRKIEASQGEDGGWTTQGWAPVLQSSMNNQALELAQVAGRPVSDAVLVKSREYQRSDVSADDGAVMGEKARASAGVAFYAGAATQRATAKDATEVERRFEQARKEGKVAPDAEVSEETLLALGYEVEDARDKATAYRQNQSLVRRLDDANYLAGFGNNGGEEFISYMMSSESLVIAGGESWEKWNKQMHEMFEKIQNEDGSWSGHHCITSPVICTAAALLCLTADRDIHVLLETKPLITASAGQE